MLDGGAILLCIVAGAFVTVIIYKLYKQHKLIKSKSRSLNIPIATAVPIRQY